MYDPLIGMGYGHHCVDHAAKIYVEGNADVNTLEGFCSLVKRGINGVYFRFDEALAVVRERVCLAL